VTPREGFAKSMIYELTSLKLGDEDFPLQRGHLTVMRAYRGDVKGQISWILNVRTEESDLNRNLDTGPHRVRMVTTDRREISGSACLVGRKDNVWTFEGQRGDLEGLSDNEI
jgi:hypothetical protein